MEDKSKQEKQRTDKIEEKKPKKVDIEKSVVIEISDDAGPSRLHLPGAVVTPKVHRAGLSKSEHSINHIITKQDVSDALKLSSMSFATNNPSILNFNFKDLKIPVFKKTEGASKLDSVNVVEMKKLVTNCFKHNRETPTTTPEVPVAVLPNIVMNEVQELANSSRVTVTANAQTDENFVVTKPNEVIVTSVGPIEGKQSKDKKKPSGNLSERSDLGLATRDSLSSIGSNVCRICMTRGRERLISPCNCKGSLANVHLTCLERWLNQVGRNHCELCGYSYPAIRTPRYTVLQALRLWFGNPRNRSHLQSDCLIFWLLSTVTAGLLAVCIVGTQYFVIEGNKFGKAEALRKEEGIPHRITETAMDFFMAVVLCGYSVTVYLLWKDHYVMWNRWRRANVNVRLLLSPDANPVPFVPRSERVRYNVV